uniref:Retrotrans_gag domain-containing protein n=1 Tax=Bursaphelenchus xylophilus TaxID=6326 RepID=A0A1I7RM88_BURXY
MTISGVLRQSICPTLKRARQHLETTRFENPQPKPNATEEEQLQFFRSSTVTYEADHASIERCLTNLRNKQNEWHNFLMQLEKDEKRTESEILQKFEEDKHLSETIEELEDLSLKGKKCISLWQAATQRLEEKLNHGRQPTTNSTATDYSNDTKPEFHMPRIHLPKFRGSTDDWKYFEDMVKEFLLQNTSLSDTVKMQYLTNSLEGEARRLIIPRFSCTGTNLNNAWKLLKQKYGNEYTQKQRLVDKIITMRKPDSNSSSIIRFITDIESILMQMETLGMDTNTIEIITAIEKALPDRIRRQQTHRNLNSSEKKRGESVVSAPVFGKGTERSDLRKRVR